jgi:hypothetical protein
MNLLNPWYVTGITDGDGSFNVRIVRYISNKKGDLKWRIFLTYTVVAEDNIANRNMLELLQAYWANLGCTGSISVFDGVLRLNFDSIKSAVIIRNHFITYPLLTYKLVNFNIWSSILDILLAKEHLTTEGFLRIIGLKALFKNGLSNLLLSSFPNFIPNIKPDYLPDLTLINIHWISGFINADGCFFLLPKKDNKMKLGERITYGITISQNIISLIVLESIASFFGFGNIRENVNDVHIYRIDSLKNINTFISVFNEAKLQGAKALDYADFCRGIELINQKQHLSQDGLNSIKVISNNMNTKRTKFE